MPKKGFRMSAEQKRKIGISNKGKLKGYRHSAETRRKMSLAKLGRPGHPHTPESKRKLSVANSGPRSHNWKGGRKIHKGYVMLLKPDHPNAYSWNDSQTGRRLKRYVFEHRYVMSQILGRPLDRYDIVHHINGDKTDNRPENLEHLRGDNVGARRPIICPKCKHAF